MNREELAELIARLLHPGQWWDKDPHPADRAMWMDRGRAIADVLRPALSAELHNSIMNGELILIGCGDPTDYTRATNYAQVHRWIDASFGPMPTPDLADVQP